LPTVQGEIVQWGEARALVIERYDRTAELGRIHQEDLCQALSVPPDLKYQAEGGPGPGQVADALRLVSSRPEEDVRTFVDALIFSAIVASTDGHAKNYSILIEPEGRIRLAPLYDMASLLEYPEKVHPQRLKLAMSVGGEYHRHKLRDRHWARLAEEVGIAEERVMARLAEIRDQVGVE
ncbi:MAG: HipA domain-containing protein, partial [Longimicrobiales bacterium]|nr:HipA domain-containing protein [Longimicrobiales bacterium]